MKKQKTITISKLEYEQLQAEAALMWEMTNDYGEQRGDGNWGRIGLVFLHACGVRFPAEEASDPIPALPLLFVAVARKPPASQLKTDDVGRGTCAAADAVVLACRSFH